MKAEDEFYKNLLEVVIYNDVYIFDLDVEDTNPKEVNFIHGIDQLIDDDRFVNTGTSNQRVAIHKKGTGSYQNKKLHLTKTSRLFTNEQVSLYFKEVRIPS